MTYFLIFVDNLKARRYNKEISAKIGKAISTLNLGKHWWTDGENNHFCKECPGENFKLGRSKKVRDKISKGKLNDNKNK